MRAPLYPFFELILMYLVVNKCVNLIAISKRIRKQMNEKCVDDMENNLNFG